MDMDNASSPQSFSIVIPALNEEQAIGGTIERCQEAARLIKQLTPIEQVEIIVVSDGSTDRTAAIARSYEGVSVIEYEPNRGYGAAIKLGFELSTGDLLGFLDGDGTCDARSFVDLCRLAIDGPTDVALGSRMHRESRMPIVRRIGNRMFAVLLSYLSNRRISDTASGMRVVRREALSRLYPLPDGLHFTPAMTCRALLHNGLTLRETPVPYRERLGRSKLGVIQDGFRFLHVITDISLTYRPLKLFGGLATLLLLVAFLYGLGPVATYVQHRMVPDAYIYRLITINTLALAGLMLLTIGIVAERAAAALNGGTRPVTALGRFLLAVCSTRNMLVAGPVLAASGVAINIGTIRDYFTTWSIGHHWVYVTTGALLVLAGMQLTTLAVFDRLLTGILERKGCRTGLPEDPSGGR